MLGSKLVEVPVRETREDAQIAENGKRKGAWWQRFPALVDHHEVENYCGCDQQRRSNTTRRILQPMPPS